MGSMNLYRAKNKSASSEQSYMCFVSGFFCPAVEEFILFLLLIVGVAAASSIKDKVFGEISEKELEYRLDSATSGYTIQMNSS